MQRVGKQKQARYLGRLLSRENTCLPASIRVAPKEDPPSNSRSELPDRRVQPFAVGFSVGRRRWPESSLLTKGQVAAEDGPSETRERGGDIDEQGGTAVPTGPVRKHKPGDRFAFRFMQITEHRMLTDFSYSHR
jgi:hypothetical protein